MVHRRRRRRRRLLESLWVARMKSLTVHAYYGKLVLGRMAHRLLGSPLAASL